MNEDNLYTIKKGDTFWDLENEWGIPRGTLQELNPDLEPRRLQIGQKIEIKMPTLLYLIAEEVPKDPVETYGLTNSRFDVCEVPVDDLYSRNKFSSFGHIPLSSNQNSGLQSAVQNLTVGHGIMSLENIRRTGLIRSNELWHLQKNGIITHRWKTMVNGASHWRNSMVSGYRTAFQTASKAKGLAPTAMKYGGPLLLLGDVGLSGEVKPSHVVSAIFLGAATTGYGAIFAGIYFAADIGVGITTGRSISQRLDGWVEDEYGTLELYEGVY